LVSFGARGHTKLFPNVLLADPLFVELIGSDAETVRVLDSNGTREVLLSIGSPPAYRSLWGHPELVALAAVPGHGNAWLMLGQLPDGSLSLVQRSTDPDREVLSIAMDAWGEVPGLERPRASLVPADGYALLDSADPRRPPTRIDLVSLLTEIFETDAEHLSSVLNDRSDGIWISLGGVVADGYYYRVVTDVRSSRRLVIRYAPAGVSNHVADVSLAWNLIASSKDGRFVLAVQNVGTVDLILYRTDSPTSPGGT